jgi:DNA-binding response OmpR family regulator
MRHPQEVISRTVIAERVWGDPFYVSDNVIDVTVSGLRQKLADASDAGMPKVRIETIRGVGYRLITEADSIV